MSTPSAGVVRARVLLGGVRAAGSRFFVSASYTRKWLVLGCVIGLIAGSGAIIFYEALREATHLLLGSLGGYRVPTPAGEGNASGSPGFARPWAIPLVVGGGGLVSGILVFGLAPEAEGHGTDAAISAVHHNPRGIRFRTVIVKIVASAVTIGSGGSGGREGPTGQISAGFGSLLARFFDLSPADARICVASGIGSGIGSIFSAPLGGAVLAAEILYRDDVEVEALLPSFIASIIGYALFGAVEGYGPLFGMNSQFRLANAQQLGWFALIGIVAGLVGLLYAKGFYGIGELSEKSGLPRFLRPAAGGLLVGLLALEIPEVLGTGYGFVQRSFGPELLHIPLWIVLAVPFARILATGLSIGTGGSGGIFGPGMVIGAFLGASFWDLGHHIVPGLGHDPAPYVITGMMACFGSISRAPLAVMIMVAEMTGSLTVLVPAMLAVGLATLIVRRNDDTIYRSQLRNRGESPAHRVLAGMPLLSRIPVSRALARPRLVLAANDSVRGVAGEMERAGVDEAPVTDEAERYLGVVTRAAIDSAAASGEKAEESTIAPLADTRLSPVQESQRLDAALEGLTTTAHGFLPVVDGERRVVGTLAISDMVKAYRRALQATLQQLAAGGEGAGIYEVVVEERSALSGTTVRRAGIPPGVVLTGVERERAVLLPDGRTELRPGDRLVLLATPDEAEHMRHLARETKVDDPNGPSES